jgi:hypothetical protein
MADKNPGTHFLQAIGIAGSLDIRAGDPVALIEQHLGHTAHAGTADTNEMNALDAAHFRDHMNTG